MPDAHDMGQAGRVLGSGRLDRAIEGVRQEVVAGLRFDRHELALVMNFQVSPQAVIVNLLGPVRDGLRLRRYHSDPPYVSPPVLYGRRRTYNSGDSPLRLESWSLRHFGSRMVALESQTRRSAKRWLLIGGLLVASAVAVVVAVGSMSNPAMVRARDESVRVLSLATDASAMEDAVGSLGIIFHLADGAWIAVRYVDCHALPIWSKGVALDSKGRWFESDVHFCGQFKIYRGQWERTLEVLQNPKTTSDEKKRYLISA